MHTGKKIFHCDECDKRFTRRSTLKIHKKIHTGIKDFQCKLCILQQWYSKKSHENPHRRNTLRV